MPRESRRNWRQAPSAGRQQPRKTVRRVDVENNATDRAVVKFMSFGLTAKAAVAKVGGRLSLGQAYYRARSAGVSPRDWRNGKGVTKDDIDDIEKDLGRFEAVLTAMRRKRAAEHPEPKTRRRTFASV